MEPHIVRDADYGDAMLRAEEAKPLPNGMPAGEQLASCAFIEYHDGFRALSIAGNKGPAVHDRHA